MNRLLLILLLALSLPSAAAVYEWQDADGKKHYTDQVTPEAKTLSLPAPGYSYFTVSRVYDGDTIELSDGNKIRLLGINTPEVQHFNKQADAGGDEAKRWLTEKLKNRTVRLVTDVEKTDKYGRTLAHVFTDSKEHINLELVATGLAEASIYPPNLLFVDELVKAQNQAEKNHLGIWQRPEYAPIAVDLLTDQGHTGWTRIVGKVDNIKQTKKSIYLNFTDQFSARIDRDWESLFPDLNSLTGKTVEVRGWLNKNRGKFSMLLRHPSAIKP
jgi:endonuclease YncB( thermonuclease family)